MLLGRLWGVSRVSVGCCWGVCGVFKRSRSQRWLHGSIDEHVTTALSDDELLSASYCLSRSAHLPASASGYSDTDILHTVQAGLYHPDDVWTKSRLGHTFYNTRWIQARSSQTSSYKSPFGGPATSPFPSWSVATGRKARCLERQQQFL